MAVRSLTRLCMVLEQGFVRYWKLDTSERKSDIPGKFWNDCVHRRLLSTGEMTVGRVAYSERERDFPS